MAKKHYQFHYAELIKGDVVNLGTLCYSSSSSAEREILVQYTRKHLNRPDATIIISHVTKLSREEFELEQNGVTKG